MSKLEIPHEVADGITLACLQDQLKYLKKEVKDYEKKKAYMHSHDYDESKNKLIPSLEILIKYFGG